ncbi:nucleotidyltransferase family protein [Hyphomonas sp.]|uniref:nucleotidyltransferase family protein n=1 Tax=Hyphomonas sp. TaxID=87 RepID=UPI003F707EF7
MRSVPALVLAGARASGDPLCLSENVPSKALLDIHGEPMLARVLRALTLSHAVQEPIRVAGLDDDLLLSASGGMAVRAAVSAEGGPAASLMGALAEDVPIPLLVTTCDHALLTPEMVDYFLEQAIAGGADLAVGLTTRETIEDSYPQTKRTYLAFGGSELSGCNLFYIATPDALRAVHFWRAAEQDRKRPWRIARRFGPLTALRILLGRPGVEKVFEIVSARLGARIGAVILPFAEAAIDVDSTGDLELVRGILAGAG